MIEYLLGGLVTAVASLLIFYFNEFLQKRKAINAVKSEILTNLFISQTLLPIAKTLYATGKQGDATVFDLKSLYTSAYEDLRRSGYSFSVSPEIRENLRESYMLITEHNRQTLPLFFEYPPRTRGYVERIEKIIKKLENLKNLLSIS